MSHTPKSCVDCPRWPAGAQTGCPTPEKIQACIRHVLGDKRHFLTGDEFLAAVEAYRQKRLREPLKKPRPFVFGDPHCIYVLGRSRMYVAPRPQLIIPEDLP